MATVLMKNAGVRLCIDTQTGETIEIKGYMYLNTIPDDKLQKAFKVYSFLNDWVDNGILAVTDFKKAIDKQGDMREQKKAEDIEATKAGQDEAIEKGVEHSISAANPDLSQKEAKVMAKDIVSYSKRGRRRK